MVAAALFAGAASAQHSAVGATVGDGDPSRILGPRRLFTLVRSPRWLGGIGLTGLASALHVAALALAPVSIVQPVGVLAVPLSVMMTARRTGRPPGPLVLLALTLTVVGVTAFVVVNALGENSTDVVETLHVGLTSAIVGAAALALAGLGALGADWVRCVTAAAAGAVLFGLASALVRTIMLLIGTGRGLDPWTYGILAGVGAMYAVGGVLVQQAFATGPAEVILGCLTTIDPLVAVAFGIAFLGEGDRHGASAVAGMVAAGALAVLGTILLARHHPDARAAPPVAPPPLPGAATTKGPT